MDYFLIITPSRLLSLYRFLDVGGAKWVILATSQIYQAEEVDHLPYHRVAVRAADTLQNTGHAFFVQGAETDCQGAS